VGWPSSAPELGFHAPRRTGWRWALRCIGCCGGDLTGAGDRAPRSASSPAARSIPCSTRRARFCPGSGTARARAFSSTAGTVRSGSASPPPSRRRDCETRFRSARGSRCRPAPARKSLPRGPTRPRSVRCSATRCSGNARCSRFGGGVGRRAWASESQAWQASPPRCAMPVGLLWRLFRFPARSTAWAAARAPAGLPISSRPPTRFRPGCSRPFRTGHARRVLQHNGHVRPVSPRWEQQRTEPP
jgi:hypothetical protein